MDEGYIKFNCKWIPSNDIPLQLVWELNLWREKMYEKGLIGMYPDGIGFGNISMRWKENEFLISGTATGGLPKLNESHYSLVTDHDLSTNSVTCTGPIKASSESLTHAAIYECSATTNAVIHIHNLEMWKGLMNRVPTSNDTVPYGTPGMANEIKRLFAETPLSLEKIMVMGGHEEGIISFGKDLGEAGHILLENWKKFYK
jgi:ribulose-5-phosphate 4-epimerase/fuculose-1-phosphate aldolase